MDNYLMPKLRTTLTVTAALAAAVTLAACSSSTGSMGGMNHGGAAMSSAPTMTAGTNNTADVTFVTGMIPHHTQAVTMVDSLLKKDGIDPKVIALAAQIKAEQAPEIDTMTGWLTTWGVPESTGISGMDMGTGMGMMSEEDMSALDAATGTEASKLFLTQMTQHHEGAIGMANTEVSSGQDPDALALAKNIVSSQTEEIQTMTDLLNTIQ
ncbi:DUF305 domain-containing protein [Subtercola boreus]|uniref:DUF305 domain-containing protein n=2 Tax=Subtercola boreus TaxID=120213 RepID=A0A3E0VB25_9MICO|nr:DUF305 domain-containing protein [Subtercola boreus]